MKKKTKTRDLNTQAHEILKAATQEPKRKKKK